MAAQMVHVGHMATIDDFVNRIEQRQRSTPHVTACPEEI